jgi:hypothetical protein
VLTMTLPDTLIGHTVRRPRHVVEVVLHAFHHACDTHNYEIAWRLLVAAETAMQFDQSATTALRRTMAKKLVSAHERLWTLRKDP